MSIRDLIAAPSVEREEVVEFAGRQFKVVGKASASLLDSTFYKDPAEVAKYAAHFQNLTGEEFSDVLVRKVFLVQATLVADDVEGRERYDPVEIAMLAVRQGAFFHMLVAAAFKVTGFDDQEMMVAEAAAGESGASGPEHSSSGSASEAPESPAES